ncbi:hypothetical protein QQF73_11600 [Marinobacter sp. M216]|uniref:Uncharacterized protein n=1 Tax=Marinobacter albus TaxID=3030833 RepID=A0ABT7HD36_9GAMM|nr:hypothetical protein [Marinobacter sp. M216]MDK9558266.1 hypothetical protein [Marinobacter sp. M216]
MIVSVGFVLFITGFEYLLPFLPAVFTVGAISALSGLAFAGSKTFVPAILGGVIALGCCVAILLYAVSNI